jgi:hypothetical protein
LQYLRSSILVQKSDTNSSTAEIDSYLTAVITGTGSWNFKDTLVGADLTATAITINGNTGSNERLQINLIPNPEGSTSYNISLGYPVGFVYNGGSGVFKADGQTLNSEGNILEPM